MLIDSAAEDIVYTSLFSGVNGNYLRGSVAHAGLDPITFPRRTRQDEFRHGGQLGGKSVARHLERRPKRQRHHDIEAVDALVARMERDTQRARELQLLAVCECGALYARAARCGNRAPCGHCFNCVCAPNNCRRAGARIDRDLPGLRR